MLKRGPGNHKGNLPFKCSNCGIVWNISAKREDNDDDEEHINRSKPYRHKNRKYTKRKGLYSRENSSSCEESDGYVYDIEKEEFLSIAMDIMSTNMKMKTIRKKNNIKKNKTLMGKQILK